MMIIARTLLLFIACVFIASAFAQTTYTYPGTGALQEQNGTRINSKRYTSTAECVSDAWAELRRRTSSAISYTYPGFGALQEQSGAAVNSKRYSTTQQCIDDAWSELRGRKAANPAMVSGAVECVAATGFVLGTSAVECVASTGYVMTWPTPVTPPPPPATVGLGRLPANPRINAGSSTADVGPTTATIQGPNSTGDFRTVCKPSHFAFDDPIVFPGQPGRSHLHLFFGNTGVNGNSTESSVNNSGNSTCVGGILNRSSYWIPAMIDTATGDVVMPTDEVVFYYKSGYGGVRPEDIRPIPKGLRMIAGDATNSGPAYGLPFLWVCHNNYPQHGQTFPDCAVGDQLEMSVTFPQCWNGVDLDSPDHKSHMAYPTGSGCPADFPVALPEVSLHVLYPITRPGQAATWRLSSDTYTGPAGYSAHADFWASWDDATMNTFVTQCLNRRMNCHARLLGDGRILQ